MKVIHTGTRWLCMLSLVLQLSACAWITHWFPPRIDASSTQAFDTSLAAMREALPVQQRPALNRALQVVQMSVLAQSGYFVGDLNSPDADFRRQLQGKSAADILAMGDAITQRNQESEQAETAAEIKDLEARKQAAAEHGADFARFKVLRANFYKRADMDEGMIPVLEIAVENGTPFDIASVNFTAALVEAGKTEPLIKQSYGYRLPEVLRAGTTTRWVLPQKKLSLWSSVQALPSRHLVVSIDRLFDEHDASPFPDVRFTAEDAARLEALKPPPTDDKKDTAENKAEQ